MSEISLADAKVLGYKAKDSWWTVLLVDPLAIRIVYIALRYPWITPNLLTVVAFFIGLLAAGSFLAAAHHPLFLIAGAVLFHISFIADCMDGKVARIRGISSYFGEWLDYVLDRVRVLACAVALAGGQYLATGQIGYWYLAIAVVFLDMFRYLNALQIHKLRSEMQVVHSGADAVPFKRVGAWLARRRVRPHLIGGIELQMAVFIVGPLTGWIPQVTAVTAVLFLLFELAIIYKLWLATKDHQLGSKHHLERGTQC